MYTCHAHVVKTRHLAEGGVEAREQGERDEEKSGGRCHDEDGLEAKDTRWSMFRTHVLVQLEVGWCLVFSKHVGSWWSSTGRILNRKMCVPRVAENVPNYGSGDFWSWVCV